MMISIATQTEAVMKILDSVNDKGKLAKMSTVFGGNFLKAVVDIRLGKIAVDAELHADLEAMLLGSGSAQEDLWGINFYPGEVGDSFIEFDSLINIRPKQDNPSRDILDSEIRKKVVSVVNQWIK